MVGSAQHCEHVLLVGARPAGRARQEPILLVIIQGCNIAKPPVFTACTGMSVIVFLWSRHPIWKLINGETHVEVLGGRATVEADQACTG